MSYLVKLSKIYLSLLTVVAIITGNLLLTSIVV